MEHWSSMLKQTDKSNCDAKDSHKQSVEGSQKGASGFFVSGSGGAGDTVLTTPHGETIAASEFTEKEVYEIGLSRVSGSGVVYLLYPDPSNIRNN